MTQSPLLERTLEHCVEPSDLDRVHQLLGDLWTVAADVDEHDRIGFELAVIEVAGNIAEHSSSAVGFDCELVVQIRSDALVAEFHDTSDAVVLDLDSAQMPDDLAESGRGLALARAAVDELTYERSGERNTWRIFRRRRPAPVTEASTPTVANPARSRADRRRLPVVAGIVLVVEDDPDLGGFLLAALKRRVDRQVRLVENAAEALRLLEHESVDVLITDIQMPGMSGLELVSRVRQMHPALPIIMMTAHASVDYAISALRHQVDEFLVKPVSAAGLVPRVQELAARGAAARETARALADIDPATSGAADLRRLEREMLKSLAASMGRPNSLSQQLEQAAQVQRDLLPRNAPALPGWDVAGICLPSFAIGGDFFDWYPRADGLDFAVADVMGKGIPAALVTATVRAVVRGVDREAGPGRAMRAAASGLIQDLSETGTFVTMFLGRLDGRTGVLRYADAGHGLTLHVADDGRVTQLVSEDLPLGIEDDIAPSGQDWTENAVTLAPGDTLVSFSDGLFDLLGGDRQAIADIGAMASTSRDCSQFIATVAGLAAEATLIDDVTVVAVRRLRGES